MPDCQYLDDSDHFDDWRHYRSGRRQADPDPNEHWNRCDSNCRPLLMLDWLSTLERTAVVSIDWNGLSIGTRFCFDKLAEVFLFHCVSKSAFHHKWVAFQMAVECRLRVDRLHNCRREGTE